MTTSELGKLSKDELAEELHLRQIEEFNREAWVELLPEWCENVAQNITIARRAKNLSNYPRYLRN